MRYLGDFQVSGTVYVYFDSFDSNGASITMTGLAVTDIEIYKDGSITQRSSDVGYTLLGIDFDLITGIHGFSIDLADDTDAGFFAAGSDYVIVVSTVTIDTRTVSFIAAEFSIENRAGALSVRPTVAGRTLDITATGAVGIDLSNVENQSSTLGLTNTTVGVVTTNTDMRGTDSALLAANVPANFSSLVVSVGGVANSNVSEIAGDATAATNLKSSTETMITGLTTGIPTTTNIPTNLTETVDNQFGGRVFILRTGTFARQAVEITAYNGTTKTLTVNALTGAPAASDAFVIV